MKKSIVAMAALLMAATAVNAQIYLGGSVGFGSTSIKPETGDKGTSSNWNITPTVGYYLNDRFDIGLDLNLGSTTDKTPITGSTNEVKLTSSPWKVTPFARYSFFQVGKFEAIAKLAVDFGGGKTEREYSTTPDANTSTKYTKWGINLSPVLAWSLTDNVVLYTTSDILTLGYNSTKVKDGDKTSSFGLKANAGGVANTSNIQIGFIYKF